MIGMRPTWLATIGGGAASAMITPQPSCRSATSAPLVAEHDPASRSLTGAAWQGARQPIASCVELCSKAVDVTSIT